MLTQPQIIDEIHGISAMRAPISSRRTRSTRNAFSLADYGMEELAYEMNVAAAKLARRRGRQVDETKRPRSPASSPALSGRPIAPRRSRPTSTIQDIRNVDFDDLREAYKEQMRGLIDGGSDIILIETIFDTLNAKAAGLRRSKCSRRRISSCRS